MGRGMADRFRHWFEYEKDAHAKVIGSLESVPAERHNSPEYQKAVDWLAHLANVRRVWLGRLGEFEPLRGPLFPEKTSLPEVVSDLTSIQEHWSRYLATLTDDALWQTIEYKSLDGSPFRNELVDILTQLFGHSSYHRGQIATLVKAAGGRPAMTDYIYWCRQAV